MLSIQSLMAWSKTEHRLIPAREAKRLTGLAPDELLEQRGVQELTRIQRGMRQTMLRIPLELMLDYVAPEKPQRRAG